MGGVLLLLLSSRSFTPPAGAAELTFAPSEQGKPSTLTFHNTSSLGDFEGVAPFTGHLDTTALKGELTIAANSLTTANGPRDTRMEAYCLESARFTMITFRVTTITGDSAALKSGVGSGTISLTGPLTIRDVTKTVSVPASFTYDGTTLRLNGRYDLKWADYGVPDPGVLISTLNPDMYVSFDLLATAAPRP